MLFNDVAERAALVALPLSQALVIRQRPNVITAVAWLGSEASDLRSGYAIRRDDNLGFFHWFSDLWCASNRQWPHLWFSERDRVMADDRTKRGKADRIRINVHEKWEFDYWKDALGISGQQLGAAVRAVGPMVKDVKAYLKSKK